MSSAPLFEEGTVVAGAWKIDRKLGAGACGEVFSVSACGKISKTVQYDCVMKVCPLDKGKNKKDKKEWTKVANTLHFEYMLYQGALRGFEHCPRFPMGCAYGEFNQRRYLIMERMEGDLMDLATAPVPPTLQEVASYGTQILTGMQALHQRHYVFIDVKPDNFMYQSRGGPGGHKKVVFIDFGIAQGFVDPSKGCHREEAEAGAVVGTPSYVSLAVHNGTIPARRDDVEAVGLVLLCMLGRGSLPWSNATSEAECKALKNSTDIRALASSLGAPELGEMIMACRGLAFSQVPDYSAYDVLLEKMGKRKGAGTGAGAATAKASKAGKAAARRSSSGSGMGVMDLSGMDLDTECTTAPGRRSSARRSSAGSGAAAEEEDAAAAAAAARAARSSAAPKTKRSRQTPATAKKASKASKASKTAAAAAVAEEGEEEEEEEEDEGAEVPVKKRRTTLVKARAPPKKEMRAVLEVVNGPCKGLRMEVGDGQRVRVGRKPKFELVLDKDPCVSWEHAEFCFQKDIPRSKKKGLPEGWCTVQDLGSTNGIEIGDDEKVFMKAAGPIPLPSGELVGIGDSYISVTLTDE